MVTTTSSRPKPKFRASFETFLAVVRIGIANYLDNQLAFEAKNIFWTVLVGTTMDTDADAIDLMPDEYTRAAQIEELKGIRDANVVSGVQIFADLDSLIEQSFPETQWLAKRKEAGSKFWGKAASNAGACSSAFSAGKTFIINNHAALLAGGMLTTFQATFTTLSGAYTVSNTTYKNAAIEAQLQTDAKIIACNDLYARYMVMAKVAKNIFRLDKAMKNGFVFGTIKKTINPQHQVLETVKIKKDSSKTIHNAVIDAIITNTGTKPVLVCPGIFPCTLTITKDKPIEETKETIVETKEPITAKEETKAVEESKPTEKEETIIEETKTPLTTMGTLLMPNQTMINTLGEIITFTVYDPFTGSQVSIKRTVHDK